MCYKSLRKRRRPNASNKVLRAGKGEVNNGGEPTSQAYEGFQAQRSLIDATFHKFLMIAGNSR